MLGNPENIRFYRQFCKRHHSNFASYICDREQCDHFLSFQCFECRQDSARGHDHECPKSDTFVEKLHEQKVAVLTSNIRQILRKFQSDLTGYIKCFCEQLNQWYSPLDSSTTERQFVHSVENPSKWAKVLETASLKDSLIEKRLKLIKLKFKRDFEEIQTALQLQMKSLKYSVAPEKWKFSRTEKHELLNIGGFADRTADKKSDKERYCVALLNQPITPFKDEVSITVNSQNVTDKLLVLGLCQREAIVRGHFETNLKNGVYAICQASKDKSENNALSLHCSDPEMHYKQAVGWNFKSGDTISISVKFWGTKSPSIEFKKKHTKQSFSLSLKQEEAFLYPFVALYGSGDKVSIQG